MRFYKNNNVIKYVSNNGNIRIKSMFKFLNKELPLNKPVKLIQRDLKECFGYCMDHDANYLIVLHKSASYYIKIDTLIHEYAHAITMYEGKYKDRDQNSQHNTDWGICFAKTYRCYLKFLDENKQKSNKRRDQS